MFFILIYVKSIFSKTVSNVQYSMYKTYVNLNQNGIDYAPRIKNSRLDRHRNHQIQRIGEAMLPWCLKNP